MAVARHADDIEVQDEDQDDTNYENDTAVASRRTNVQMSEEGHYESLDLQKIDEAVYGDLRTKTRKRKGQPKTRQSGPLRVVAWCLGILCLIQLGVIIMGLVVHFNNTERNMTYYNNVTMQITQLKYDYKNLSLQITQLKNDYKNLSLQNVLLKDEVIQLKSEAAATTTHQPTTVSDRKAVIKQAAMSEDMQRDAVQFATQALEKYNDNNKDISKYISEEFNKKYKPYWHCFVGRNYGYYVYNQANHYISFYMGQVRILLFKSRN